MWSRVLRIFTHLFCGYPFIMLSHFTIHVLDYSHKQKVNKLLSTYHFSAIFDDYI